MADDRDLRRRYPGTPTATLARQLRRSLSATYARAATLGVQKSAAYLASPAACRLRRRGDDHPGKATQFRPGQVPVNKGLRRPGWGPGRMKDTQFKKGCRSGQAAQHHRPIGSTRLVDGYVYVKVADVPNVPYTVNWLPLHILEWERVHGPLPAGSCLWFTDGDRQHVDVANLELHTRAENMARNSVHNLPKPLAQAVQLLGALTRKIRRSTRDAEHDR